MIIVITRENDDSFGEIWELDDRFTDRFNIYYMREESLELYKFVQENGKKLFANVDCNITLPNR